MKKSYLIIIGVSAILILFIIWLYLLIYGTPTKVTEVFTNFGIFDNGVTIPVESIIDTPVATSTNETAVQKLRQLTTKPVVGFREFQASSSEPKFVKYVEAGTGHVFSINLNTGEETRISNTTVPNAEKAVFTGDGKLVAVRSGYSNTSKVALLTLNDSGTAVSETLQPIMSDFIFSTQNELMYSQQTSFGMSGYGLDPITKATRVLFTVPFQSATISWGVKSNFPTLVYPKATAKLNGYLYQVKNGTLARMPVEGKGLTAESNGLYSFFTTLNGGGMGSQIFDQKNTKFSNSSINMEPNKCAFSNITSALVYCGYELTNYATNFPDEWYKGERSFNDNIYSVNLMSGSASLLTMPEKETGRQIDITDMQNSSDGKVLYFKNKNDNTLWMYEI